MTSAEPHSTVAKKTPAAPASRLAFEYAASVAAARSAADHSRSKSCHQAETGTVSTCSPLRAAATRSFLVILRPDRNLRMRAIARQVYGKRLAPASGTRRRFGVAFWPPNTYTQININVYADTITFRPLGLIVPQFQPRKDSFVVFPYLPTPGIQSSGAHRNEHRNADGHTGKFHSHSARRPRQHRAGADRLRQDARLRR